MKTQRALYSGLLNIALLTAACSDKAASPVATDTAGTLDANSGDTNGTAGTASLTSAADDEGGEATTDSTAAAATAGATASSAGQSGQAEPNSGGAPSAELAGENTGNAAANAGTASAATDDTDTAQAGTSAAGAPAANAAGTASDSDDATSNAAGGANTSDDVSSATGEGGSGGMNEVAADNSFTGEVTLRDATVDFRHVAYSIESNGSLASENESDIVTTTFNVKIIENDLVKVTVLPEYGGRILSIIYKPTDHELLYQNSVGDPYGAGEGNFYYDWLMVYGGIFPTVAESEHGKAWALPWTYELLTESADEVALRMTFTDDIGAEGNVPPGKFGYGKTDLTVSATVRVVRGSAAVDFELSVTNNRDTTVDYEYWTCTTLAPGSTPGSTASPANSEIIAPIDEVSVPSWVSWVDSVETSTGSGTYTLDRLRNFSEWSDMGILYAQPRMTEDYWGVINHENEVGVFRVADSDATPGLKFWTWGADSVNTDPAEPNEYRPYIELWAGHSREFFNPAQIAGNETKSWTETYFGTVGLSKITTVNQAAAVYLSYEIQGEDVLFSAELFSPEPGSNKNVTLLLNGSETLLETAWQPSAVEPSRFSVAIPSANLGAGALGLKLTGSNNEELLISSIEYED